jgi:Txe/YoeB family toxin of Txe-Axe toxin-antitoxin module
MIQFRLIYNVKKKTLQNGMALIQIRAHYNTLLDSRG